MRSLILCFLLLLFANHIQAQESTPIVFIYDASGSMWGQMEAKTKHAIAQQVIENTVSSFGETQKIGLVAYGHRRKSDCEDVEWVVPIENLDKSQVINAVKGITPLGKTPLAYSAGLILDELKAGSKAATIILITDGIESCDGNLCKLIENYKTEGIEFRFHIIGFGLKEKESAPLKCAADAGEGRYFDANSASELESVLQQASSERVDSPEPNCSVSASKNNDMIDAMIRVYDASSGEQLSAYRTYRETVDFHLAPGRYHFKITALENTDLLPIEERNISVKENEELERQYRFDSGTLNAFITVNGEGWDAIVHIYPQDQAKKAASGRTYSRDKDFELNPGVYRIETDLLRVKGKAVSAELDSIIVQAEQLTKLNYDFQMGAIRIGARSGEELVDAAVSIRDSDDNSYIDGGRTYTRPSNNPKEFLLSPGKYSIELKALGAYAGKSQTIQVNLKQGDTVERIIEF